MKKVKFTILIVIILISGIVLVSLWLNLQEKDTSGRGESIPKFSTDGADAHLEKIRLVEDKHGRKTWELEAKSIQQYQDQNIILLEDVRVTYVTKEGRCFVISGKRGKIYQDSKDLELMEDVVLVLDNEYKLKTHSISYHHSENKITTPDPVEIEGKQIRIVGKGIMVDMEGRILKVLDQTTTQWRKGEKR